MTYDHFSVFPYLKILRPLFKRILAITNHRTGYGLTEDGQEHFAIIQYNIADEYTPHCDGSCDGMPHMKGGRVATAVMYLKTPDVGGGTVFTNTNLHIRPRNNTVVFFSYRGEDGLMDTNRYTEHSGCPVIEGEKWIATFWMRDGVSKTDPWTNFDPNGRRMSPELSMNSTASSESTIADTDIQSSASLWETSALYVDRFLIDYVHETFLPATDAVFSVIKRVFYSSEATSRVYDIIEERYIRSLAVLFPSNPGFMGSVVLTTVPVLSAGLLLLVAFVTYLLGGCRRSTRSHRLIFRPLDPVGPDDYHRVVAGGLADRTSSLSLADRLKKVEAEDLLGVKGAEDAAALEEGRVEDTVEEQAEPSKPARRTRKTLSGSGDTVSDDAPRAKTPSRAKTPARRQGRASGFANDESPFVAPVRRARSKTPGSTRKRS